MTQIFYSLLKDQCDIRILPALGTHTPLTPDELKMMYGDIPKKNFIVHDWREDTIEVGVIPSEIVKEKSEDKLDFTIKVEINRHLKENYNLIISIGQVVPHEVSGMANGNKNILVGVGGSDMINKSHFLSACYGMERIMGRVDTPVRQLFDYAESSFLEGLPLLYVLTVLNRDKAGNMSLKGLFGGETNQPYKEAALLSQKLNLTLIDNPLAKIIVYLDPNEYKSTWLGNKAIYRTRMAIKDEGELIILAPGIKKFGEDRTIDQLIRKYGYDSSEKIIKVVQKNIDLQENLSAAAHLIHGSSENRFNITYCTDHITRQEIEGVKYQYGKLAEQINLFNPKKMNDGYNKLSDGEEIFFIRNPALGLWTEKNKL